MEVKHINPSLILADDNSRFGLIPANIDKLKQSILDEGQINEPLHVAELDEPTASGHLYRVISGHYRHAAATAINKDQGDAAVLCPIIIDEVISEKDRLLTQIRENVDRTDLTPMDKAVAMKRAMEAGLTRKEVCTLFAQGGGKKGFKVSPISNSMLNMHISFLTLPKPIQTKIHLGFIGVSGAYELLKRPAERHEAILEAIEKSRLEAIEKEESDEEAYLESEEKRVAEAKKLEDAQALAKKAQEDRAALESMLKTKKEEQIAALQETAKATDAVEKKKLQIEYDQREKEAKEIEKKTALAVKEAEKTTKAADSLVKKLEDKKKALEEARKSKAVTKAVSDKDVKAAGKKIDVPSPTVPLNRRDILEFCQVLAKDDEFPKMQMLGGILASCYNGLWGYKLIKQRIGKYVTGEISLTPNEQKEEDIRLDRIAKQKDLKKEQAADKPSAKKKASK